MVDLFKASVSKGSSASGEEDGKKRWVALLIGWLLIVAAFVKVWSATTSSAIDASDWPPWLSRVAVQSELVVGSWLVLGASKRNAWYAAIGLFAVFAAFSLYRAIAGFQSCGCFGSFKIHPWRMLICDVGILAILVSCRREFVQTFPRQPLRKRRSLLGGYLVTAISLYVVMAQHEVDVKGVQAGVSRIGDLTVLKPELWIGQRFPITDYLDPPADLSRGEWFVLLHRHDCPRCQAAVVEYEGLASQFLQQGEDRHVLLVEIPPFTEGMREDRGAAARSQLNGDQEWFVQTPVEVRLSDGGVVQVSSESLGVRNADDRP